MSMNIIIVFKEPVPGKVKTRLGKRIGYENAADFYSKLLNRQLNSLKQSENNYNVFLFLKKPAGKLFKRSITQQFGKPLSQKGKNIGEVMDNAIFTVFKENNSPTVLIGSDIPTVDKNLFDKCNEIFKKNEIILGPSTDGGYYLIGMRTYINGLFNNIEWSNSNVLHNQIRKIEKTGASYHILEESYDIDDYDTYKRFIRENPEFTNK